MELNRRNIRQWAREAGWEPRNPGSLKVVVHDEAIKCECGCGRVFTSTSDFADRDETPDGEWWATACFEDFETQGGYVDPVREWGTR